MINFSFYISNPFVKENFDTLWHAHGAITEHKTWELEVSERWRCIVEFDIRFTLKQDHAGLYIGLGLFGYSFCAQIYDNRHWNHDAGTWETPPVDITDGLA